ncbi:MAG: alanine racemase [Candidatus Harrisonbacteria bacterium CG10_big_fil_rev_8_21_14_0_10_44_23]|uniref:Alanine racemase n=1 Tax=Candidatus Harrisonbacteria bacterium CG10_big_fil_rev_8_21_14_0_10_44_23 TaxID=1974585 RepID=A0A2H0UQN2_9BACT|nr:MAG: alanine racemase [Candidatus Harrisonbacteria bacterium CG10_big_fil_rev_8_21_14_0_10_44_23]
MAKQDQLKTWIEISKSALENNLRVLGSFFPHQAQIWAVTKSNAYGHGIFDFGKIANELEISGFCVDSIFEAAKLRQSGVKKPILIIGSTLANLLPQAARGQVAVSVSNWEALEALAEIDASEARPEFHLKVDTGMHRQGFELGELKKVFSFIKKHDLKLRGIYSHLAAAKDPVYKSFSERQFGEFKKAIELADGEGFGNILKHFAATPGILSSADYVFDLARVGIGLYGYPPSKAWAMHLPQLENLEPVLSWHALISEIKSVRKGEYLGYDLSARVAVNSEVAILPIGYWHGIPPALGNVGEVLVNGKRAKILGKVAMDVIVIDVTGLRAKTGDEVVIIGKSGKDEINAWELATLAETSPHEILTRLNPLIKRVIVD